MLLARLGEGTSARQRLKPGNVGETENISKFADASGRHQALVATKEALIQGVGVNLAHGRREFLGTILGSKKRRHWLVHWYIGSAPVHGILALAP